MVQHPGDLVDGDVVLRTETGGADGIVFEVRHGGRTVGQVGVRRSTSDVGLLEWDLVEDLDPSLAARALRLLLGYGFGAAGLHRVEAHVDPSDRRVLRSLSHAGLRREGILRGHTGTGTERADRVLMARLGSDPGADTRDGFIAMLNAGLPRKRVISQAVILNEANQVLLCELTYKTEWDLPGGVIEPLESPATGLRRELREELGLEVPVGDLLTVNWLPAWRGWDDACVFVFDAGAMRAETVASMRLQQTEIRAVHWCTPDEVAARATAATTRLLEALADPGRRRGYLEDGTAGVDP